MSSPFANGMRPRVLAVTVVLAAWFFLVLGRLIHLQVFEHTRLKAEVLGQSQNEIAVYPERGTITDRNGKILARSLPVESVYFSPSKGGTAAGEMARISGLRGPLGLTDKDMARIGARVDKRSSYILIKRKADPEAAARAMAMGVKGLFLQGESKRFYPQGSLAAHVLGGVGIDDNGQAGVEGQYDRLLEGEKGKRLLMQDARRRSYSFRTIAEAKPGQDLRLTIDETIQYIAESELEKAVTACGAVRGTVVVMSPDSGEILALASLPTYAPLDYDPETEAGRNQAIARLFEPGSTFKIVTAAAARASGRVGLGETYDCRKGSIMVGGAAVRDHKPLGILTFPGVFIESSNVGSIMIAQEIGAQALYDMIRTFRFGEKTGIDLPSEEAGKVYPLSAWTTSSFRVAIGYEVSVTAIQVLRAMNVFATRGLLVRPHVTLDLPAGDARGATEILPGRVTDELLPVFEGVVEEGTGMSARLEGYDIAGKTGTAQKIDAALGAYSSRLHLASFVGFVPAERPVLSMIVVIDEPRGLFQYGGQLAAPVFREIAARVLRYLRVVPKAAPPALIAASLTKGDRP
jgi:cell division protein FtsI/penicillin-binding protein 2